MAPIHPQMVSMPKVCMSALPEQRSTRLSLSTDPEGDGRKNTQQVPPPNARSVKLYCVGELQHGTYICMCLYMHT